MPPAGTHVFFAAILRNVGMASALAGAVPVGLQELGSRPAPTTPESARRCLRDGGTYHVIWSRPAEWPGSAILEADVARYSCCYERCPALDLYSFWPNPEGVDVVHVATGGGGDEDHARRVAIRRARME